MKISQMIRMAAVSIKKIPRPASKEMLWAVEKGGKEIGFITKFKKTKTELDPYKAYVGKGLTAKFLGAFYDEQEGKKWNPTWKPESDEKLGGMKAAIHAIEMAAH